MAAEQLDSEKAPRDESQTTYFSFLLRLWREGNGGEIAWRASLEDAQSREQHGFADLGALVAFLQAQISRERRTGGT